MVDAMQFPIGIEVHCGDGVCGELTRVVIDPVARKVTYLVVEPDGVVGGGRLVPLALVDEDGGDEVKLKCSLDDFGKLEPADETHFLPGINAGLDYPSEQAWSLPYYGLGNLGGFGMGTGAESLASAGVVVYERLPLGEIDLRRGEAVHASDGAIGKVQGVVVDPRDHHMTHVVLQEGHLWGKKQVVIPIDAIRDVKDGIQLSLTKEQVKGLPEVDLEHPLQVGQSS